MEGIFGYRDKRGPNSIYLYIYLFNFMEKMRINFIIGFFKKKKKIMLSPLVDRLDDVLENNLGFLGFDLDRLKLIIYFVKKINYN